MAVKLLFPDNRNVIDTRGNAYNQPWLKFINQIYLRLQGVDSIAAVASTDAAAAGATYSQAHINSIVTELNETKAQLNALLTALQK